jgi:hypothetical protein
MAGSEYDWNDLSAIAVRQQDTIAVYANEASDIVIRRQKDWNEEEDSIIVVSAAFVTQLIEAIERTFKEIQAGRA